jgi:hypothetical protein
LLRPNALAQHLRHRAIRTLSASVRWSALDILNLTPMSL